MKKIYGKEMLYDVFHYFSSFNKPIDLYNRKYADNGLPVSLYSPLIDKLIHNKILILSDTDDENILLNRKLKARSISEISLMYHIPTTRCNYSCSYCFIENKIDNFASMTKEVSRRGIDYFASQTKTSKEIKVTFYGGEPLLNKEVVYDAIEYIRESEAYSGFSKRVQMTLLTNGSMVDEEAARIFKKYDVKTSVSIDGPCHIHDKTRLLKDTKGSFEESLRGYRLLQQAGLKPSVSCTLSRFNTGSFDEVLSFIIKELKPSGVGFNILLPKLNEPYIEEVETATSKIIDAFKAFREAGIYEDRMMRRARPFCTDSFHYKDCYGVGGQIVLTPDGRLGPCQAYLGVDRYFPVSLKDPPSDINSDPLFAKWIERFTLNNNECLSCRALAICGGGCPYAAEVMAGSMDNIDRRVCQQCLPIFDWMIWDLFEHLDLSKKEEHYGQQ